MHSTKINSVKNYMEEIGRFELLTPEEEKELGHIINGEDKVAAEKAREKLINSNLRLVVSIAKKYQNEHFTLLDLIGEGNMGLIKAVEVFNPDLGFRFSTCATPWIKSAISKAIANKGRNIRLPQHIYNQLRDYRAAVSELIATGNEEPTAEEISAKMGITLDKYNSLMSHLHDTISLSTPLGDESDDTLEDVQPDMSTETPEEKYLKKEQAIGVHTLLAQEKDRTQRIIALRYGLEDGVCHTLEETGKIVGLTRERVRQIEKETLTKLKRNKKWQALYELNSK